MSDSLDRLLEVWDAGEAAGGEHDLDKLSKAMEALRRDSSTIDLPPRVEVVDTTTEYSAELVSRGRGTGLIWAVQGDLPASVAIEVQRQLQERFPHVVCAVAPGVNSIAFEWDEPDEDEL